MALLLAGCSTSEPDEEMPAGPEAAVPGDRIVLLEDCLGVDAYVPLPEKVFDTGEYKSRPPGLAGAAGFQQGAKAHALACAGGQLEEAEVGPVSIAFIGVHIEDVPKVHSVRPSDGDGVFLPLQVVASPGAVHDLVAGLGFPVVDGSVVVEQLPAGRTASVEGAAAFRMVAAVPEPQTDATTTGFASENMFVGPSGWLSLFGACTGPSGGTPIAVETGSSVLQEAGAVLHSTQSQDYACSLELIYTPY